MRNLPLENVGGDWSLDQVNNLTDEINHISPSEYNEKVRYLPESISSMPGYLNFDVSPWGREIVDCFDIQSPVREVNVKKGAQVCYTTLLESGMLYFMGHIKTLPIMYLTADKELADIRIENNIIPMLHHSDLSHIIQSSDIGNSRKTGKNANQIQFIGGGYLMPQGANNANKMRQHSICILIKDEIDGWPQVVGGSEGEGCPDKITDQRCKGYWNVRKIFRGSTPKLVGTSKIEKQYLRGDQRKAMVLCLSCQYPQELRWKNIDKDTGVVGGFHWQLKDGTLDHDSVCYCCEKCGHQHFEHHKEILFSPNHGAHWKPTANPVEPNIRSYHLPAMYSPIGMAPWYSLVADWLECYDQKTEKIIDVGKYQVFKNTVLAEPWQMTGANVKFSMVSAHRRAVYRLGEIPNKYALKHSQSPILFLSCQVDVHDKFLAVSVMGWTAKMRTYVIEYWHFEDENCLATDSPVWGRLRKLIEETIYVADDGQRYGIAITLIDSSYGTATVNDFCSVYGGGVYPIMGRDSPGKNQKTKEFTDFTTQVGTMGFLISVDYYKDRLAPVLRREWFEESGEQEPYHFNAPVDILDSTLKELTVEYRQKKTDPNGVESWSWYRPGNARNELWDLLVYGHAAVEIKAWAICIKHFEMEAINWSEFWQFASEPQSDALFARLPKE